MKVEGNDRAFAAWEDLRRRVEALENSIPLNSRVDPPGCPACDGVAGTECRCDSRECCTDGTCESCAPLMAWFDYRKDYEPNDTVTAAKHFHAGWKAAQWHYQTDPVAEPVTCACGKEALPPERFEKVTDSQYTRTTHASHACWSVSPIFNTPEPVMTLCFCGAEQIVTNTATERRGKKHTALKCGLCCTHGVFLEDRPDGKGCEQCYPKRVPEWRRLVSDQQFRIPPDHPPLATVLHCLARIERGVAGDTHVLDSRDYLARIVAVCEAQVGDGWQADPDSARLHAGVDVVTSLLNRITMWPIGSPPIIDWEDLGHGAAERLRDLTEEQS